jgi:hypothetical protein
VEEEVRRSVPPTVLVGLTVEHAAIRDRSDSAGKEAIRAGEHRVLITSAHVPLPLGAVTKDVVRAPAGLLATLLLGLGFTHLHFLSDGYDFLSCGTNVCFAASSMN